MYRRLRSLLSRRRKPTRMLDLLPTELLLQIAHYLSPNLASLNSLSRSSQRLYLLINPILHTTVLRIPDRRGRFIMHVAAATGNTALLQRLLVYGNSAGVDGRVIITGITALHSAIMLGHLEAVRVLLRHGARVDVRDRRGWNALHWAVLSGNCEMAREVLEHGARPDWGTAAGGSRSMRPLHMAVARGDTGMVRLLVRWGASCEVEDESGVRAVEYATVTADAERASHEMLGLMGHTGGGYVSLARRTAVMYEQRMVDLRWRSVILHEEWFARLRFRI